MFKIFFLFLLLSTSAQSGNFFKSSQSPSVLQEFDEFIFDHSMKTIIMSNLRKLKSINKKECSNTSCKFILKSPDTIEIHKEGIIKTYVLKR